MVIKSPHANPLEVVEAAVGVVDVAWTAIEKRRDHAHHDAVAASWEDRVKLEGQLAQERSENHRLKAALEELQRALHEVRNEHPSPPNRAATAPSIIHDDGCPSDLYEQLQKKVDSPSFLERLKDMHDDGFEGSIEMATKDGEGDVKPEDSSSWVWVTDDLFESEGKEELDGLDNDSYIIVSQDDVIEGVATFVAKLIVSNPNAKKMTPKQVQEVISLSFSKMERKGKLRKLWSTAKFLYTSATWTTAAVGLYRNPLIVKAIVKALSMSSRLVIKVLT